MKYAYWKKAHYAPEQVVAHIQQLIPNILEMQLHE